MNLQWIGALLIVAGCGSVGFGLAMSYKREEAALRQLIRGLEFMSCELEYRLTPLPELCRRVSAFSSGCIRNIFSVFAMELDSQIAPEAEYCMRSALERITDLPPKTGQAMSLLGQSLGQFDAAGQLRGLESVRISCVKELEELEKNRTQRIRSYQTLGLCAGAALAILFI